MPYNLKALLVAFPVVVANDLDVMQGKAGNKRQFVGGLDVLGPSVSDVGGATNCAPHESARALPTSTWVTGGSNKKRSSGILSGLIGQTA